MPEKGNGGEIGYGLAEDSGGFDEGRGYSVEGDEAGGELQFQASPPIESIDDFDVALESLLLASTENLSKEQIRERLQMYLDDFDEVFE